MRSSNMHGTNGSAKSRSAYMSPPEAGLHLERLQRVVHNRAITCPVDELPHAAGDGAVAAHHVWKALANVGACIVDRACRAVQKYAAGLFGATKDGAFVLAFGGVPGEERGRRHAQMPREPLDIALGHLHGRHAATVGAHRAIDLLLDALGDAAQDAIGMVVRFHVPPEALVFVPLLFAEQADLHQVGDHAGYHCQRISRAASSRSSCAGSRARRAPAPVARMIQTAPRRCPLGGRPPHTRGYRRCRSTLPAGTARARWPPGKWPARASWLSLRTKAPGRGSGGGWDNAGAPWRSGWRWCWRAPAGGSARRSQPAGFPAPTCPAERCCSRSRRTARR